MTALHPGSFAIDAQVKSVTEDGAGGWTAVASSPTLDRDGEIIDAGAFNPLPAKVPVHDQHYGNLIGSARPYYRGGDLLIDGTFASTPLAQTIRTLVREKHLETMSVVFMQAVREKGPDGVPHITSGELLAVDFAPISSNREARVLASRSYRPKSDDDAVDRVRVELALLEAELALLDPVTPSKSTTKWARGVLADAEALLRSMNGRNHR